MQCNEHIRPSIKKEQSHQGELIIRLSYDNHNTNNKLNTTTNKYNDGNNQHEFNNKGSTQCERDRVDEGSTDDESTQSSQQDARNNSDVESNNYRGEKKRRRERNMTSSESEDESDSRTSSSAYQQRRGERANYKTAKQNYNSPRHHSRHSSSEFSEGSDEEYNKYPRFNGRSTGYQRRYTQPLDGKPWENRVNSKKKLWVGGLPPITTTDELKEHFKSYGLIVYVVISQKGSAFVKFSEESQALDAFRQGNSTFIRGNLIRVKFALKLEQLPHNKLLFVNNIPSTATKAEIREEFEKYGEIEELQLLHYSYAYCFVNFMRTESAVKARKSLKSKYFIQFGKIRPQTEAKVEQTPKLQETTAIEKQQKPFSIVACESDEVLEPLSEEQTWELTQLLNSLQPTKISIKAGKEWILQHGASMSDILLHMSVMLVAKYHPFSTRLSILFLIHDVLSYCTLRRSSVENIDTISSLILSHLQRVISKFTVEARTEEFSVLEVLNLWEKHKVFPVSAVSDMRKGFVARDEIANAEF